MAGLRILIKKKRDGSHTLTCVRSDGSVTGQRQGDDEFYVLHDLMHYAVETTLGLKQAFFGMLASGWDITDFGSPWPRGRIPPEAAADASLAEFLVGAFDLERYCGIPVVAETFHQTFAQACREEGIPLRGVTEDALVRIRTRWSELKARLDATLPGEALELLFPMQSI